MGAHNASINHTASFNWTQFETIGANVPRSQGLVVNWTGGSPGGTVAIQGQSQSAPGVGAYFYCFADAAAGSSLCRPRSCAPCRSPLPRSANPRGRCPLFSSFSGADLIFRGLTRLMAVPMTAITSARSISNNQGRWPYAR